MRKSDCTFLMSFSYTLQIRKDKGIIHPEGKLMERYEAESLLEEVHEAISQGTPYFVLDLKNLEYLNSSGLNVLINILTRARNAGGDAVICNVSSKLKKLIVMTKLDSVFVLCDKQTEALQLLDRSINSTKVNGA